MSGKQYKIGMISLGCPKNQVDAEQMLGVLAGSGYTVTPDRDDADVIVVNTCGFIESAKEESIQAVLEAARMKEAGRCRALVVAGCLAQRYRDELLRELPEADAIIGTSEIGSVAAILERVLEGKERVSEVHDPSMVYGYPRLSTTPPHYRYLKIAEGCSNRCSYCAIPLIRGNFTSRPSASILEEARRLADEGAKELVLLAQDSTGYRDGAVDLPRLLRQLAKVPGIEWVRLMYAYPGKVSDELLRTMASEEKVCKYLDIPVQHIDDRILAAMDRRARADDIRRTLERLRTLVPGISIRTSLIVGFPGETEAAFRRLLAFVAEAEFEHLGAFTYSPEEGTKAASLPKRVTKTVAEQRRRAVMQAQAKVSRAKNRLLIGSSQRVIVDGMEDLVLIGRTQGQAPEIDGVVYLSEVEARPGDRVTVTITDASEYDLRGTGRNEGENELRTRKGAR